MHERDEKLVPSGIRHVWPPSENSQLTNCGVAIPAQLIELTLAGGTGSRNPNAGIYARRERPCRWAA
jgi:hypothetical protein